MRRTPWPATGRSVGLALLWFPAAVLLVAAVLALVLSVVGVGLPLLCVVLAGAQGLARVHARLAARTLGRDVPVVALPGDGPGEPPDWGLLLGTDARRVLAAGDDPARLSRLAALPFRTGWRWLRAGQTWSLLGWLAFATTGGALLTLLVVLLPLAAVGAAVDAIVLPPLLRIPAAWVVVLAGGAVVLAAVWWWWADALARLRARAEAALLAPGPGAVLERRVQDLAESRADTVDHAAAELRRVERDLHDGAQARLVSVGMQLGMVADLLDRDPDAARALLEEARGTTAGALADLRDVVQGIHPPVLADRGLSAAVQALALDLPVPVTVVSALPGRPPAALESALYFAVAETLTNAVRHASATHVRVELTAGGASLRVVVADDGVGGADPGAGSGLRGVARRLSAFDGTMGVDSPHGGPTRIVLEVPCAWSSPKTTPS
ncbi:ATP-binding protein [Cellulomonas sp. Sa3CUA2]|uniref:histidine kinase n=1 Tax=Cellulomonas avistercoris TaxID=2762242 RepID=A0ABR8QDQ1_9CELL|nr:histidine kinase [Cellulomonas avistercoris]MBD7918536.1 ATP-binding protein [Cellulomonas avistercoris]